MDLTHTLWGPRHKLIRLLSLNRNNLHLDYRKHHSRIDVQEKFLSWSYYTFGLILSFFPTLKVAGELKIIAFENKFDCTVIEINVDVCESFQLNFMWSIFIHI